MEFPPYGSAITRGVCAVPPLGLPAYLLRAEDCGVHGPLPLPLPSPSRTSSHGRTWITIPSLFGRGLVGRVIVGDIKQKYIVNSEKRAGIISWLSEFVPRANIGKRKQIEQAV